MTDQPAPVFDVAFTQSVCDVLAQTDYPGLSTSELISVLRTVNLSGLEPGANKRERLLVTLHNAQVNRRSGRTLIAFMRAAMSPTRYVRDPSRWNQLRDELNAVLVLYSLRINDEGKLARGARANTLSEAATLSGELHSALRQRQCHPVLLTYCSEELIARSLFHATSEAAKSLPDRIRRHTGLAGDGAALYDQVFAVTSPLVTINAMLDDSDLSEHKGFKNLLVAIHGHYRNPRAHRPRVSSSEDRADFLDAFSLFSYAHRRLDRAGVPG